MNALPRRSLVRRLTWGVLLVVLLAFGLQGLVLSLWLRPLAGEFIGGAADTARMTRAALSAAPAAEREALARALSVGSLRVQPYAPELGAALGPPPALDPPELASHVRRLAEDGIQMTVHEGAKLTDTVTFRFELDGRAWWLVRQVTRPTTAITGTLTLWLLMIALVTACALLWSVRAIARPLADLAAQLGAQQGRLQPLSEERFNSRELHTVVQAFNELAHQVSYQGALRQQLLAGVSHDLRTPLARLRLRVETQCPDELAGELTADLLALEHIVDQFLAYVQGDTAALPGTLRPLADCVNDAVAPYLAAGQPVTLRVDPQLDQSVPPLAVRRLLGNLIDNALDYGRPPVHVLLRNHAGCTELAVWDQGPGMTEDEFGHALQPFVRLGGARTDVGHCGLGLAIATQMARQLGGRLHTEHDAALGFGIVLRMSAAKAGHAA
jgi:two-component system, OmpR family, osmolarity sensor histidine kinase EnvZ